VSDPYLEEARRRGLVPPAADPYVEEAKRRGLLTEQPVMPDGSPGVPIDLTPPTGPAPPPAPPSDPSRGFVGGLKLGTQAVGRAGADLIGGPVDLATGALNLGSWGVERAINAIPGVDGVEIPKITNPVGGSENIADLAGTAASYAGFKPYDVESLPFDKRLLYQANRFGAQALGGAAGLRSLAMGRAAQVDRTPQMFDALLRPYESGSVRPIIGDVGAGVGAGTAIETGREVIPEKYRSPLVDMLLGIVGGVGGSTLATGGRSALSIPNAVRDSMPDPKVPMMETRPATTHENAVKVPVSRAATQRAARYAQENATNPAQASRTIADEAAYYADAGLPTPTTGTMSRDVGLGAVEQGDRVRNPVPYQEADQKIRSAATTQLNSVAPEGGIPRAATEFAGKEARQQTAAAEQAVKTAEQQSLAATAAEQATAAPYREPGTPAAASRKIDEVVVDQTMKPRMAEKNAKFAAIDPEGKVQRDVTPMLEAAARVRESLGQLNDPNTILPQGTLARIEALAPKVVEKPGEPAVFKVDQMGVSEKVPSEGARMIGKAIGEGKTLSVTSTGDGTVRVGPPGLHGDDKYIPVTLSAEERKAFKRAQANDDLAETAEERAAAKAEMQAVIVPAAKRAIEAQKSIGPVVEKTGGTVGFQDLNKLRPELSDAITAARAVGNHTLADNLKALKREINNEVDRLAAEGGPDGAAAKEALDYYKTEFAPYFGADNLGGKLRKDINADSPGRVATPPSKTADRFLNVGLDQKERAADLRKILEIAPDPAAGNKAVREYILSDLAKTADANGTINPMKLKDWITKREDMLSQFPEVDAEVKKLMQDVVNSRTKSNLTATELKKAIENAKLTQQDIERGSLSLVLDASPDVAVARVFGAPDREKAMADVVRTLGKDKTAAAGWKKAVSEYMISKLTGTNTQMTDAGDMPAQFAAMQKFFRDHEKTLSKVYSPEEMNALQKAKKMLEPFGALSRRATAGSPTAENNTQAWRTMEAALKAYYGVLKGGGVLRTVKLAASTLPNNDAQVGWLIHKMQFDPELAVHLLNQPLKDVDTPMWNSKLNRLLGYAAASREDNKFP
jgi:hypothetical protein